MNGSWNLAIIRDTPLLRALHPVLAQANWPAQSWPDLNHYQALLDAARVRTARDERLRVVPALTPSPGDEDYEHRIYRRAELVTRSKNWHDCFNLLAWATFPRAKAVLNARHVDVSAGEQGGAQTGRRLPARDALTQFDESGVILAYSDASLAQLVRGFQWKELFWERREAARAGLVCFLFGHGLMEKALTPYTGMTGKALLLPVAPNFMQLQLAQQTAFLDGLTADFLSGSECWTHAQAIMPLPILGIPGFYAENTRADYYENLAYFRPGRAKKAD